MAVARMRLVSPTRIRHGPGPLVMVRIFVKDNGGECVVASNAVLRPVRPLARHRHQERVDQRGLARVLRPNNEHIQRV